MTSNYASSRKQRIRIQRLNRRRVAKIIDQVWRRELDAWIARWRDVQKANGEAWLSLFKRQKHGQYKERACEISIPNPTYVTPEKDQNLEKLP